MPHNQKTLAYCISSSQLRSGRPRRLQDYCLYPSTAASLTSQKPDLILDPWSIVCGLRLDAPSECLLGFIENEKHVACPAHHPSSNNLQSASLTSLLVSFSPPRTRQSPRCLRISSKFSGRRDSEPSAFRELSRISGADPQTGTLSTTYGHYEKQTR